MYDYEFFVYILTNKTRTVLYTGMTNALEYRIIQHYREAGKKKTFTGRYYCYYLVYYEEFNNVYDVMEREVEIKGWSRAKKETLINSINPAWKFLNYDIMEWPPDVCTE